jgi:hypothetical protein
MTPPVAPRRRRQCPPSDKRGGHSSRQGQCRPSTVDRALSTGQRCGTRRRTVRVGRHHAAPSSPSDRSLHPRPRHCAAGTLPWVCAARGSHRRARASGGRRPRGHRTTGKRGGHPRPERATSDHPPCSGGAGAPLRAALRRRRPLVWPALSPIRDARRGRGPALARSGDRRADPDRVVVLGPTGGSAATGDRGPAG